MNCKTYVSYVKIMDKSTEEMVKIVDVVKAQPKSTNKR